MTFRYGICTLSAIPGRVEPADASEMVTQLLFGEHYAVLERRKKWLRIKHAMDGYECWIDKKQHHEISEKFFGRLEKQKFMPVALELVSLVRKPSTGEYIPIMAGSSLPFLKANVFQIDREKFEFDGVAQMKPERKNKELLEQNARLYLNAPYLWGGRQTFGIDCSGFTQVCYKMIGHNIPRDSYQQASLGHALSFIEEAEPGDLAFFDNEEGRIIHVGMLLRENQIIHASGKVRIDRIDHQGIYNNDLRDYSHRLRIIKRLID